MRFFQDNVDSVINLDWSVEFMKYFRLFLIWDEMVIFHRLAFQWAIEYKVFGMPDDVGLWKEFIFRITKLTFPAHNDNQCFFQRLPL